MSGIARLAALDLGGRHPLQRGLPSPAGRRRNAEEERQLKSFLYAKMYRSPPILAVQGEAKKLLAGMTDRYVIARHRELVGPVGLPEGF